MQQQHEKKTTKNDRIKLFVIDTLQLFLIACKSDSSKSGNVTRSPAPPSQNCASAPTQIFKKWFGVVKHCLLSTYAAAFRKVERVDQRIVTFDVLNRTHRTNVVV